MTLSELTKQTVEAAETHSPFEGYKWEIEAADVLKLLEERRRYREAMKSALELCPPEAYHAALVLRGALDSGAFYWPSEE